MYRNLAGMPFLLCFLLPFAVTYAQSSAPLAEDDPAVWQARRERAVSLRKDSSAMRELADNKRAREDVACRSRFFENACKDSARDRWIEQINKVRAMEMEAAGLEQGIRAWEVAQKQKERDARPPQPNRIIIDTPDAASVPAAGSPAAPTTGTNANGSADTSAEKPRVPNRSSATNKAKDAAAEAEQREQKAQAARERAEQAKRDAARYAARAKAHAEKSASSSR